MVVVSKKKSNNSKRKTLKKISEQYWIKVFRCLEWICFNVLKNLNGHVFPTVTSFGNPYPWKKKKYTENVKDTCIWDKFWIFEFAQQGDLDTFGQLLQGICVVNCWPLFTLKEDVPQPLKKWIFHFKSHWKVTKLLLSGWFLLVWLIHLTLSWLLCVFADMKCESQGGVSAASLQGGSPVVSVRMEVLNPEWL